MQTPPTGAEWLDGSGNAIQRLPATKWFEHGNATARTGTQWADPDRVSVGFQGLFVEPWFVLRALKGAHMLACQQGCVLMRRVARGCT
jgi:hypothetical protein